MSALRLALTAALALTLAMTTPAQAHGIEPALSFAVIGDVPRSAAEQPATRTLLDAIGAAPGQAFIIDYGNIKGADEPCSDQLFAQRKRLLDAAPVPLVYVPGQHDWVDCLHRQDGQFDTSARLDAIRERFFDANDALGRMPLTLVRQSDIPAFRPYRENVRWQSDRVLFITLNVPGGNNHFVNGGGRNGEFEDRQIANRFWITHAAALAKRRNLRAMVIVMEGDPHFETTRGGTFAWLDFGGGQTTRDGYAELRRDLLAATATYSGNVLLIHAGGDAAGATRRGFRIDQPLHDAHGIVRKNLTRVQVSATAGPTRWIGIRLDAGSALFRISAHSVSLAHDAPAEPEPNSMPQQDSTPATPPVDAVSSDTAGLQQPELLPIPDEPSNRAATAAGTR